MFKNSDYIIISIICFFLGIIIVSQVMASKKIDTLVQPENNEVLAVEVGKLTKVNADLRREVQGLTETLNDYNNSTESNRKTLDLYNKDMDRLSVINGEKSKTGQGVVILINGRLNVPQIVDLINAIKNIGADIISINETRLTINTSLNQFSGQDRYEIKILGNSKLLKSAMERKGGIFEQIANKDIIFSIEERSELNISSGMPINFKYSKIIE